MIGTANAVSITTAMGKFLFVCHHRMGNVLELEMEFLKCSKDASKPAVSWLNFEPMVSKFPVIGTAVPFQSLLLRGNSFLFAIIRWETY